MFDWVLNTHLNSVWKRHSFILVNISEYLQENQCHGLLVPFILKVNSKHSYLVLKKSFFLKYPKKTEAFCKVNLQLWENNDALNLSLSVDNSFAGMWTSAQVLLTDYQPIIIYDLLIFLSCQAWLLKPF